MADNYSLSDAFKAIEDELIASMMRNFDHHKAEESAEDMNWTMWQSEQLKSLEQYKQSLEGYKDKFTDINGRIDKLIRTANQKGGLDQELEILEAIKAGFTGATQVSSGLSAKFFSLNERKLEALIKATTSDMEKAEYAILRKAEDSYRSAIYNAQVYANSGAGTYGNAVDMATKDMLSAGLTCVQYKNGAVHTLEDYADMAIKTAAKRAYLQGEGAMRQEWGIHTVIVNKRTNPCPHCLPFAGKVFIDDVWSGGTKKDGDYPLLSTAIAAGLYHPRCKDSHTTYFPGISSGPEKTYTKKELKTIQQDEEKETRKQYAQRQADKYDRLSKYSLDEGNRQKYAAASERYESAASGIETNTSAVKNELEELFDGSLETMEEALEEASEKLEEARTFVLDVDSAQNRQFTLDASNQDYAKIIRDTGDTVKSTRHQITVEAERLVGTKNTVYLSEAASLKPRQLHNIDNGVSKCLRDIVKGMGFEYEEPTIIISTIEELSYSNKVVLASYRAADNTLCIANIIGVPEEALKYQTIFAASDNELSTIYHELFHWSDAQEYIYRHGGAFDSSSYLEWVTKKAKKKLDALEEKGYNLREISEYASGKLREGRYDEVYTEYRVKKLLGGL